MKADRSAILAAVVGLVREKGAGVVTMRDIAERAGVSPSTLENRFGGRGVMMLRALESDLSAPATSVAEAMANLRRWKTLELSERVEQGGGLAADVVRAMCDHIDAVRGSTPAPLALALILGALETGVDADALGRALG